MGSSLTEIEFELSTNIIKKVVSEIKLAKEYIRIAMFQIHNEEVFSTLLALAKKGIRIEILTLPYESINDDVRKEVEKNFEALKVEKVHLHFDKWNVGSSERTTTATNRWYSFHGKFIVTDKSAIVLSANLLKNPELDVAVVFKNDEDRIGEFNGQFDRLLIYLSILTMALMELYTTRFWKPKEGKIAEFLIFQKVLTFHTKSIGFNIILVSFAQQK